MMACVSYVKSFDCKKTTAGLFTFSSMTVPLVVLDTMDMTDYTEK